MTLCSWPRPLRASDSACAPRARRHCVLSSHRLLAAAATPVCDLCRPRASGAADLGYSVCNWPYAVVAVRRAAASSMRCIAGEPVARAQGAGCGIYHEARRRATRSGTRRQRRPRRSCCSCLRIKRLISTMSSRYIRDRRTVEAHGLPVPVLLQVEAHAASVRQLQSQCCRVVSAGCESSDTLRHSLLKSR